MHPREIGGLIRQGLPGATVHVLDALSTIDYELSTFSTDRR